MTQQSSTTHAAESSDQHIIEPPNDISQSVADKQRQIEELKKSVKCEMIVIPRPKTSVKDFKQQLNAEIDQEQPTHQQES